MRVLLAACFTSIALASAATAGCYADYKAKRNDPLRLHYGVARVSACNLQSARSELSRRLIAQGWTLLQVVSVFGDEKLDGKKTSAGQYFLRY